MTGDWVYQGSDDDLWTVGFYGPDGKWHAESDHGSRDLAAARVAFLGGGAQPPREETAAAQPPLLQDIDALIERIAADQGFDPATVVRNGIAAVGFDVSWPWWQKAPSADDIRQAMRARLIWFENCGDAAVLEAVTVEDVYLEGAC